MVRRRWVRLLCLVGALCLASFTFSGCRLTSGLSDGGAATGASGEKWQRATAKDEGMLRRVLGPLDHADLKGYDRTVRLEQNDGEGWRWITLKHHVRPDGAVLFIDMSDGDGRAEPGAMVLQGGKAYVVNDSKVEEVPPEMLGELIAKVTATFPSQFMTEAEELDTAKTPTWFTTESHGDGTVTVRARVEPGPDVPFLSRLIKREATGVVRMNVQTGEILARESSLSVQAWNPERSEHVGIRWTEVFNRADGPLPLPEGFQPKS